MPRVAPDSPTSVKVDFTSKRDVKELVLSRWRNAALFSCGASSSSADDEEFLEWNSAEFAQLQDEYSL